jgi:hypothetical protein
MHLFAHRRLGDEQLLGGAGEAQAARRRFEGTQRIRAAAGLAYSFHLTHAWQASISLVRSIPAGIDTGIVVTPPQGVGTSCPHKPYLSSLPDLRRVARSVRATLIRADRGKSATKGDGTEFHGRNA